MRAIHSMIMNHMMRILNRLTSNCEIISAKISESLDHDISTRDRLKIRVHITYCKFCRRYHHQLYIMHEFFKKQLKKEEQKHLITDSGLSDAARKRIKKNLIDRHR